MFTQEPGSGSWCFTQWWRYWLNSTSQIAMPGFSSQLCLLTRFPPVSRPRRAAVMAQVIGFLLLKQEIWTGCPVLILLQFGQSQSLWSFQELTHGGRLALSCSFSFSSLSLFLFSSSLPLAMSLKTTKIRFCNSHISNYS